jgi:sulfatase modifying factor 1
LVVHPVDFLMAPEGDKHLLAKQRENLVPSNQNRAQARASSSLARCRVNVGSAASSALVAHESRNGGRRMKRSVWICLSSALAVGCGTPPSPPPPRPKATVAPPKAGDVRKSMRDGLEYVFVPAGAFEMGCVAKDRECSADEKPPHHVQLTRGFWLGRTLVTVAAFRKFATATGYVTSAEKDGGSYVWDGHGRYVKTEGVIWRSPGFAQGNDHPAVDLSWFDAEAFCSWTGGRLPSEAEWEYAARAGKSGLKYPWGDGTTPVVDGQKQANVADASSRKKHAREDPSRTWFEGYDDGFPETSPVAHFVANGFGLFDVTGNVGEWTADWYDERYYAHSVATDPQGPADGKSRVVRGGSWGGPPYVFRASYRAYNDPGYRAGHVGARCATP